MVRILDLQEQILGYVKVKEWSVDRVYESELKVTLAIEGVKRVEKKVEIRSYNRSKDKEVF